MTRFTWTTRVLAVVIGAVTVASLAASVAAAPTDPPYPSRIDFPAPTIDLTAATAALAVTTNFSPEGMAISGNTFYAGSTATGEIIKGDLRTGIYQRNFVPASPAQPSDLHRGILGLLVDDHHRLWAATSYGMACAPPTCPGSTTARYSNYGILDVWDADSGAHLAQYTLSAYASKTMNDMTIANNAVFLANTSAPCGAGTELQFELPLGPDGALPPGDVPPPGNPTTPALGVVPPAGFTGTTCPQPALGIAENLGPVNPAMIRRPTPGFLSSDGVDTLPNGNVIFTSVSGNPVPAPSAQMIVMNSVTGAVTPVAVTSEAGRNPALPPLLSLDGVTLDGNMLYAPENRTDVAACPAPNATLSCPGDWAVVHLDPPDYTHGEVIARLNSPPGSGLPPLRSPANMEQLGHLDYGITRVLVPFTLNNGVTGNATYTFIEHVDKLPVTATGSPVSGVEGTSVSGPVATVSDPNVGPLSGTYPQNGTSVAGYKTTIDWGDGSSSTGTVTTDASTGSSTISGNHTYAEEGTFTVTTTVIDAATEFTLATATSTATVTDAPIVLTGTPLTGVEGAAASGVVAHFSDPGTASDFTATIDWGDGSAAGTGTIGDGFTISGSHTYAEEGTYTVTTKIVDVGGSTATTTSTVTVADAALTAGAISAACGLGACPVTFGFTDANPTATVADFSAMINWGDGTSSPGVVSASGTGFVVTGSHDYADDGGGHPLTVTVTDDGGSTVSASAPVATAMLLAKKSGHDDDEEGSFFKVVATCSSGAATALLNGVPVQNGDVVRLKLKNKGDQKVRRDDGHLTISATSFLLVVTCTDAAGNLGTAATAPVFRTHGHDEDRDEFRHNHATETGHFGDSRH